MLQAFLPLPVSAFVYLIAGPASLRRRLGQVVAAVVAGHGGTVSVDPTPGGGATFTVRLPLYAQMQGEPSKLPPAGLGGR